MSNQFGWGTWTAERPAEFRHLQTGLRLTPLLYSDQAACASDLPPGELVRYGHRGLRNGRIEFETLFQGTHLDWCCDREADAVSISWKCRANGEWGLRYWICLCLSGPPGVAFAYDKITAVTTCVQEDDARSFYIAGIEAPLLVTAHESVADLRQELTTHGYFYLRSRATSGQVLALRYNLDATPEMSISVDTETNSVMSNKRQFKTEPSDDALQAINDVLAWNHVWDSVNRRPYTILTRNWSQRKFGGFGIWLNDTLFHALLWSMIDPEVSRQNIKAVFAHQTSAGNFPCLVTGNDAWLDRSQVPMASYVVWVLYRVTGDLTLLKWAYPKLIANHRWWWQHRALADTGLVAYGTSSGPGEGLYKGTKLAARNESAMDNMAVHDEAEFDAETGLLLMADVGLNSLLALDGEVLTKMAAQLGSAEDAASLGKSTTQLKDRIRTELWDDSRSVFANRLLNGKFVTALAPTSFFPMVAGAASDTQVEALIQRYLEPETKFGGTYSLPSAPRDQPAFNDNSYWRGRIWGPLNYWVHQGLMRYQRMAEARVLADKSKAMFDVHWAQRYCGENYSAIDGQINDQPDTDSFYTWGALLPALSIYQTLADTPWSGLSIQLDDLGWRGGPIASHLGKLAVFNTTDGWQVTLNERLWLSGSGSVSLSAIRQVNQKLTAQLMTGARPGSLVFHGASSISLSVKGQPVMTQANSLSLPSDLEDASLTVNYFSAEAE